jgi:hypothetical protein
MSKPPKIMKPIKASFTQIINAVADGRGVKIQARKRASSESESDSYNLKANLPGGVSLHGAAWSEALHKLSHRKRANPRVSHSPGHNSIP